MDRRLPGYARAALEQLRAAALDRDQDGMARSTAETVLADADVEFDEADIEHVLDLLYNRGEIYYVEDQVRITDLVLGEETDRDTTDDTDPSPSSESE